MTEIVSPLPGLKEFNLPRANHVKVVAILNEAAEHLDRVGLHKGALWADDYGPMSMRADNRCCGWGAVETVTYTTHAPIPWTETYAAEEALSMMVGPEGAPRIGHFPNWNDDPKRTKEEVVKLMHETARRLAAYEAPFTRAAVGAQVVTPAS